MHETLGELDDIEACLYRQTGKKESFIQKVGSLTIFARWTGDSKFACPFDQHLVDRRTEVDRPPVRFLQKLSKNQKVLTQIPPS